MGLARELVLSALLIAFGEGKPLEAAVNDAVAAVARQAIVSENVLRKSASHARALLACGRVGGEALLDAANRLRAAQASPEMLRALVLRAPLEDALAARAALNAERAQRDHPHGACGRAYIAVGHVAEPVKAAPIDLALALIDASSDCIELLSPDGRLLFISDQGRALREIEDFAAVSSKAWSLLWPPGERPRIDRALSEVREQGRVQRFQGICPTAKGALKRWEVVLSPVHQADEALAGILALSRDVTQAPSAKM